LFVPASVALLMLAQPAAPAPESWILRCDTATAEDPGGQRIFRLGRQVFQEWKPDKRAFGPNLCRSFPCVADRERLQGTVSSATLTMTITAEPNLGRATWQTQGASGLARTSGRCFVQREEPR